MRNGGRGRWRKSRSQPLLRAKLSAVNETNRFTHTKSKHGIHVVYSSRCQCPHAHRAAPRPSTWHAVMLMRAARRTRRAPSRWPMPLATAAACSYCLGLAALLLCLLHHLRVLLVQSTISSPCWRRAAAALPLTTADRSALKPPHRCARFCFLYAIFSSLTQRGFLSFCLSEETHRTRLRREL